jgi:hypothetical protein
MVVVPKDEMIVSTSDVATTFFRRTLGSLTSNEDTPQRILAAFMAISSLGNIITTIFSNARGKSILSASSVA